MPNHTIAEYFNWSIPITLKKVLLKKGVQMMDETFSGISGITIFVEDEEKYVRWDDNFPGWSNGNTVVYGDKWITANFYNHNGEILSSEIFTTNQVIRVPYLKIEGDAQYSYIVEGFDLDSDGKVDVIPATSTTDIEAKAIVTRVVNNYTVNFYVGDEIYYSVTLPYGSAVTLPETPQKTGYAFMSWQGYKEGMIVSENADIFAEFSHHENGHVYGDPITIAPTCEEQGYDKYVCSICGEWYGENYVDALGHNFIEASTAAPTCETEGYTVFECDCGEFYHDNFVSALGHNYGGWSVETAPTCTENGVQVKACVVCGDSLSEEVLATGHTFSESVTKQATCESAGEIVYTCHCGFAVSEVIPAEQHNYQQVYASKSFMEWFIDLLLNIFYGYEGDQAYYFKCTNCGHIATESEVELSYSTSVKEVCVHALGDWVVLSEATCQNGVVYGKVCALCGEAIEVKIGAELGKHAYKAVVTAPTCTAQGYTIYTCSTCEHSYIDNYVSALGHTEVVDSAVEPTCTETGLTEGKHCSVCGEVLVAQETVGALGHKAGEIVVENNVAPDCENTGSYDNVIYCTVCNEELSRESVTVDALGHSYETVVTAPTCTAQGHTTYTCSVCEHSYVDNYVSALGHTEVVDSAVEATCTETGLTEGKHCSVCGEVLVAQQVLPALGHSYGDWEIVKEPTENEAGEKRKTCECGHFISEEIPILSDSGNDSSSDSSINESSNNSSNTTSDIVVETSCAGSLISNILSVLMVLPAIISAWIITKKRR